jgi:hypothetical protein
MFKWTELALAFGFFNNSHSMDRMLFTQLIEGRRREREALAEEKLASMEACNDQEHSAVDSAPQSTSQKAA